MLFFFDVTPNILISPGRRFAVKRQGNLQQNMIDYTKAKITETVDYLCQCARTPPALPRSLALAVPERARILQVPNLDVASAFRFGRCDKKLNLSCISCPLVSSDNFNGLPSLWERQYWIYVCGGLMFHKRQFYAPKHLSLPKLSCVELTRLGRSL